ncbi:MAG: hypothetical protein AAGA18_11885 [Verrucomicrobiota bacterium]
MKKDKDLKITELLAIKKAETPGREYFTHFVKEFHSYQRSSMFQEEQSPIWKRWIKDLQEVITFQPRQALSYGLACAVLMLLGVFAVQETSPVQQTKSDNMAQKLGAQSENYQVGARLYKDSFLQQGDLIPVASKSFEQDFQDSQYVTGKTVALSYDTSLAF